MAPLQRRLHRQDLRVGELEGENRALTVEVERLKDLVPILERQLSLVDGRYLAMWDEVNEQRGRIERVERRRGRRFNPVPVWTMRLGGAPSPGVTMLGNRIAVMRKAEEKEWETEGEEGKRDMSGWAEAPSNVDNELSEYVSDN